GPVVDKKVFEGGVSGPRARQRRQERSTPIRGTVDPASTVKGEHAESGELLLAASYRHSVVTNRGRRVRVALRGACHQHDAHGLLNTLEDARGDIGLVPFRGAIDDPDRVCGSAEVVAHLLETGAVE